MSELAYIEEQARKLKGNSSHKFTGAFIAKQERSEANLLGIRQSLQESAANEELHVPDPHIIADSIWFKTIMISMTILNTIQMGVEVDHPDWEIWTVLENIFTAVFALEAAIKLFALRWHYFTDKANWLDGGLAVLGIVDCWILSAIAGRDGDLSSMSTLRILRFARIARIFRLVHRVKPLVLVLQGVVTALSTTLYVLLVCIFIFYVFALVLTKHLGKSDTDLYPGYSTDEEIIDGLEFMVNYNPYIYFGNMLSSMVTLFNMATFAEWPEIIRPILVKQPWYLPIFVFFATLCSFGLMNVLIGIVADAVLTESKKVEAEYQESIKHQKLKVLDKIQEILKDIDTDKDGQVDLAELNAALKDNKDMKKMFRNLHLPRGWSATELLDMLDHSGDGVLAHAEFTTSLFRLLDSNEFQQACIMQASINHVKALLMDQNKHFGTTLSCLTRDVASIKASLGIATVSKRQLEESNVQPGGLEPRSAREFLGQSAGKYIQQHVEEEIQHVEQHLISRLELVVKECIQEEFTKPGAKSELVCSMPESKVFSSEHSGSRAAINHCLHATKPSSEPMERPARDLNTTNDASRDTNGNVRADDFERVVLDFSSSEVACAMCSRSFPPEGKPSSNMPSLQQDALLANQSASYANPVLSSKGDLVALAAAAQLAHQREAREGERRTSIQL